MEAIKRKSFALYFYLCFLLFMMVRYVDGLFLYHIIANPVRSPRVDPVVWSTHYLGVPEWMTIPWIALVFDFLILALTIIILYRIYFDKKINKLTAVLTFLFAFYVLVIYCFPTLSIRKYLGLILLPIAFVFRSEKRFYSYLELMRYYVLFLFTSASLWKILRGVAWDPSHMQLTLKAQHIDNFINCPDHFITQLISTFIDNPVLCHYVFVLAILSQLSFSIGFFTKKYDKLLAFLVIIFIVSDYLVMRIEYWEFIVFLPLFFRSRNTESGIKS